MTGRRRTQRGVSRLALLSHLVTLGLVEATRCIAGPAQQAVVEMGAPPIGLPALVKRRREHRVTGVCTRTERRSLETRGPNATGSRQTARGDVTAPRKPGRTHRQESLSTTVSAKCAMTSRTNHHPERQEQGGPRPAPRSARQRRRQDAIERYLAGAPIETICREMGCAKSWLEKWKNRYEARQPTWCQERSRRPQRTPTQTPEALARAIVHLRDSVSPAASRSVSAQVIREHLGRHHVESLPSLRTIYRILTRHPKEGP
jgi:Homeodomain-like domain